MKEGEFMGKSKSRILRKGINDAIQSFSREDAVTKAVKYLENNEISAAVGVITMFGLFAEELLEGGASYEAVTAIKNILK